MTVSLVQMTIRIDPAVSRALSAEASKVGKEPADFTADVVTNAMVEAGAVERTEARRLTAELEIKGHAIRMALDIVRRGFAPDVTRQVFEIIRKDEKLREIYERAIGDRPGDDRGNRIKARINKTLGATIKTAVGAVPHKVGGKAVTIPVEGEFIRSFTELRPGSGR